jgi:SHS family sialic acid transporter-like MFS transporter
MLKQNSERAKWMALAAALLGWMFDGFEIGLFPLIGPAAIKELLHASASADATIQRQWFGVIMAVFLVGAATGGVLFGWLGDRIGRVRAMSFSILTYALFTGLCGFAVAAWQIAALRFVASLGMGGEWAIGVALVSEIWPDRSRAFTAGLIGAAANVGMILVGFLSLGLVGLIDIVRESMHAIGLSPAVSSYLLSGDGWRLLMIAGSLPAMLVFFIRQFVPESQKWEAERESGYTSLWKTRDLLGVLVGAVAATTVIFLWSPIFTHLIQLIEPHGRPSILSNSWPVFVRMAGTAIGLCVALLGYIFPVVRYLGRAEGSGQRPTSQRRSLIARMLFGALVSGIPLLGTWGSLQWAPKWAIALSAQSEAAGVVTFAKEQTQIALAGGAILGTIGAAWAADRFGRRITYAVLCGCSFLSIVFMYLGNTSFDAKMIASVFIAGATTAAFYGWLPLYLPELYPTSIRATSQGFAFNFGRVLAAVGSLQTAALTSFFAAGMAADRIELDAFPVAGAILGSIYILGIFAIWLGPETKGQPLQH